MKAKIILLLWAVILGTAVKAQTTYIPDPNFEQALIDLGYDDVLDHYVLTSKINNVVTLNVNSKNISNLTGIEAFISLKYLYCNQNQISNLDISHNSELVKLECYSNKLTSLNLSNNHSLSYLLCESNQLSNLDVSHNPALTYLGFRKNNITGIDLSNNAALRQLYGEQNQLTSINVSNNVALQYLTLGVNSLTSIDLSNNTALKQLIISQNSLTTLDVSKNTVLELLICGYNQITILDVSKNILLKALSCGNNQLTSLDVSKNTALSQYLICDDNQLTQLNVKNGHNSALSTFFALYNPNLTCIQVDNAAWSTSNWPNKPPAATYSENCIGVNMTNIPDPNFEQALINLGYDDVLDHYVLTANINTVTQLTINNKHVSDFTGIEAFVALQTLNCSKNDLTNLNLSQNILLKNLYCSDNKLTGIDISHNPVEYFSCFNNLITDIDISKNTALRSIDIGVNRLTSIDVSKNTALHLLWCNQNQLTSIDVSHNTELEYFDCNGNQITSLDLSKNVVLKYLYCLNNKIPSLDVSKNCLLITLSCLNNLLTTLDLSHNTSLQSFECAKNQIVSLNFKNGNNHAIFYFSATDNPSLTCIQVDDPVWSTSNWPLIDNTAHFSSDCNLTDSDGDGIPDNMDDYPMDPLRAFNNLFPAAGYGSLAFEDLWPGIGDYDFNDVVVDYRFLTVTDASNYVVDVDLTFVVKASGAYYHNGFGFNLPDASAMFLSKINALNVTGQEIKEHYISLKSNGFENGQSKPTVIVFDDVFNSLPHAGSGLGVNTEMTAPFVPYDTIVVHISTGTEKLLESDFALSTWNPFIMVDQQRGVEVHLADRPPTDLANAALLGTMDDDSKPSTGKFYKTKNNLPWAIDIVSAFEWPVEKVKITDAYLHFFDWAVSAGFAYGDWYLDHSGYRDGSKIYDKH